MIQELAKLLLESPDHKGAARMLARLHEFIQSEAHFSNVKLDYHREFWDAVRLGEFENPADGLANLAHRRAYARPQPPDRAISTIHKAKGLECGSVIVVPCDSRSFPDNDETIQTLQSYPALFLNEKQHNVPGHLGWITRIRHRDKEVRI